MSIKTKRRSCLRKGQKEGEKNQSIRPLIQPKYDGRGATSIGKGTTRSSRKEGLKKKAKKGRTTARSLATKVRERKDLAINTPPAPASGKTGCKGGESIKTP